ncbi:MAG TPA: hypothetical protein VHB79_26620 [Polyangiaceae bacterium]|nr:hypothetical protein [Polyangiaceae bacterium]
MRLPARALVKKSVTVLAGVLAVLCGLELIYLVAVNLVLRTRLIQEAAAGADGVKLEFGSAYSVLPGRAHVRDLVLRFEDYNVQFQLSIERGQLDVGLEELLHKRFHCYAVRADGVSFVMRHKVHEAEGHGTRLAAFPKIDGFADPPLYRGKPSPPIPDEQYDLWQVQVDDVVARARELWFLEYRFAGDAEARGAFLIRPARFVRVKPARLELISGTLAVGDESVARRVRGQIEVSLPSMDVQKTVGAAVFDLISARVKLDLAGGALDFLNAYRDAGSPSIRGQARWMVEADVERGVVQPGSRLALETPAAELSVPGERTPNWSVSGPLQGQFAVDEHAPSRLSLSLLAARLSLSRTDAAGLGSPAAEQVRLAATIEPTTLSHAPHLSALHLSVPRLNVPNLYWFEPWLSRDGSLRVDGRGEVSGELVCDAHDVCLLKHARLQASGARLAIRDRATEPLAVTLDAEQLTLPTASAQRLSGDASLSATPARALLPLVTSLPIKDAVASLLDLRELRARFELSGRPDDYELSIIEARSGDLSAKGFYRPKADRGLGAFLLKTPLMNFGIRIHGDSTSIAPLASDDWLAHHHM